MSVAAWLLVLVVAVRVVFVVYLPPSQSVGPLHLEGLNDEPSHYNYVRYLVEHERLPVQIDAMDTPGAMERGELEYFQPPLYYGVCALLQPLAGAAGSYHLSRLVALAFGLLGLWALGRALAAAGCGRAVQLGAVVFFGLLPTHVYFCSVTSNDSLSWFVGLLITTEVIRLLRDRGPSEGRRMLRQALIMGLLLGVGLLSKSTLMLCLPLVVAAYLWVAWQRRDGRFVLALGVAGLVALALCAPWYARNLRLYGELTGVGLASGGARVNILEPAAFVGFVKYTLRSLWFPMQHVPGSHLAGALAYLGTLLAAASLALAGRYYLVERRVGAVGVLLGLHFCVVLAAFVKFNLVWPNAEGRYLFPAMAFLAMLVVVPLGDILARRGREAWLAPLLGAAAAWPYLYLLLV
jgi:4-amino-4-deoxy-L-arabinose transferase-like glycosyltransferase